MIVTLGVRSSRQLSTGPGIDIELPDDYEPSPQIWLDLQAAVIAKLQEAQAAEKLADCFCGCDGDGLFRKKMDEVFARETCA